MANPSDFSPVEIALRLQLTFLLHTQSMRDTEDFIIDCWLSWEQHCDFQEPDKSRPGWLFSDVVLMSVFSHPPGSYDHTESYVIGTLNTICSHMRWCTNKWKAQFVRVQPIVEEIPIPAAMNWMRRFEPREYRQVMAIDPEAMMYQKVYLDPYRIAMLPYSYAGQGAAMTARLRLKALLPRRLRKWVSKARSGNAKPKWFYFTVPEIQTWSTHKGARRTIKYPPEARAQAKWQLWFDKFMPHETQLDMAQHIELEDFWNCATGRTHPNDVELCFVPPLFRGSGIDLGSIVVA